MTYREQLRQYSQYQKVLSHQELLETCSLFSRHFTEERLSYGLYGLFPKCRKYVDIFALMLGMAGHGLIVSMLNTHQGILGTRIFIFNRARIFNTDFLRGQIERANLALSKGHVCAMVNPIFREHP